jgi:hypothetical protein
LLIPKNIFIHSINIAANEGVFEGKLSVSVQNSTQLNKLISGILKIEGVKKVDRDNS